MQKQSEEAFEAKSCDTIKKIIQTRNDDMNPTKKELSCNQTRNVRTAFVSYSELNDKDTLFGGEIMSHFDSACGRAVFNFVKRLLSPRP